MIGGKHGWKTADIFEGIDLDHPKLVFTGFVEDEHLPALYANADAFCYPSLYEGFGLPLVEAMACGVPVIYGNNSSQIEVVGEGGIGVDAENSDAIASALFEIMSSPEKAHALAKVAYQQSHRFNWLKTALLTLNVYEDILYDRQ